MAVDDSHDDRTRTHVVLTKGTMVSHYRIVEKIGAGGMGEVYLAEDTKLKRNIALKFLPSHMCDDNDCRSRFKREAQAVAKLNHPNIITIYEVSDFNDRPFFAMELVEGKSLLEVVSEEALQIEKIIELTVKISEGLAAAHEKQVIHRDIKSTNIAIDIYGNPRILDFGLASIQGGEKLTKAGSTLGTFAYMSPEQAQGKELDHRSDIFSLGVVLYELIAGQSPFKATNDAATLNNIITREPELLVTHNPEVPKQLEQITLKCLQKDINKRYQTANDLANDLQKLKTVLANNNSVNDSTENDTTIAVLPFANMSADAENEFFADGLTEELLNVLAKNPDLKVTGRTSSFAFKNKQEDLRDIGNKLGVNSILEGSVRKSGNRVRITVQLVKTSDGFHLWSETYDRVIEDIFAVQDDIADAVSRALHVALLGSPADRQNVNPESYELALRGQQVMLEWSKASALQAIELYQKAIDIDPDNARAWAGIARVYLLQAGLGFDDNQKTYRLSKDAVLRALELDDKLADAYEVLGWIRNALEFHFDDAGIAFHRAYELAPNNSQMVASLSLFESMMGRFDEGLRLSRLALELDPLNPEAHLNQGKILFWMGQPAEAREGFQKTLEFSPGMTSCYLLISWTYLLQERFDEALTTVKQESADGYRNCGLAMVHHALEKKLESDEALGALLARADKGNWAKQIALVYAYRDEPDKAFEWLEIARSSRDAGIQMTRVSPFFSNLHSDSRWPRLLREIGFSE